ncbi:MAG: efflux RND transporter periplasmic adaptor subunit [Cyclobacteriaceae bacterium]|nr:efflux RND transporter periplasmic adaptor subunit [Cyclobacteriaceae bacterium]
MNKTVKTTLIIVIAILVMAMVLYPKLKPSEPGPSASQGPQNAVLPVEGKVIHPERKENIIKITGAMLANESVAIRSEISGKIEKIYFREGQRIRKGELLYVVNDDEIKAQLERLKYTKKLNEDMEFRMKQLIEKEAISREEYEIAQTTLNTTLSDIKEREARLEKYKVQAPFDGIVGLRQVSEGSYISPADLVVNIYNINPIKVEFSVPGKYSSMVNKGDSIRFRIEASDEEFTGVIYAIEPKIDPQTRTLQIRAICKNDDELLIPGQFVNIDYTLNVIPDALMVPSEAVIPELNSHKIFTYKNGLASQQKVSIGLRTEKDVQITKGITPGDTVITTGILQIREGMPVNINTTN